MLLDSGGRFTGGSSRTDVYGVESFWTLNNIEAYRLASLQRFIAVHLNSRVVGEQVLISTIGQDESIAFGVVEPLDLTANHADIPLQRTPSLEYHPLQFHAVLDESQQSCETP